MTPEYQEQINNYVAFALEKGLAAIQDHIIEHYEGDHLAQNIALDYFMELLDAMEN